MIWTNSQLEQWSSDALGQIAIDVKCIWQRECLPAQLGVSAIRLPAYVRTLQRVTWRSRSLIPQGWDEFCSLTPSTEFLDYPPNNQANYDISIGKPLFYAMHPTDPFDIRLYPAPNESFVVDPTIDPYSPLPNAAALVISYWREPETRLDEAANPQISLPPYILRRTQKAYVLWKAFAAEGKGQDLTASKFYQSKYQFLISQFRAINEGCFVAKHYSLGDGLLDPHRFRYPKPVLNPNFERIIF